MKCTSCESVWKFKCETSFSHPMLSHLPINAFGSLCLMRRIRIGDVSLLVMGHGFFVSFSNSASHLRFTKSNSILILAIVPSFSAIAPSFSAIAHNSKSLLRFFLDSSSALARLFFDSRSIRAYFFLVEMISSSSSTIFNSMYLHEVHFMFCKITSACINNNEFSRTQCTSCMQTPFHA